MSNPSPPTFPAVTPLDARTLDAVVAAYEHIVSFMETLTKALAGHALEPMGGNRSIRVLVNAIQVRIPLTTLEGTSIKVVALSYYNRPYLVIESRHIDGYADADPDKLVYQIIMQLSQHVADESVEDEV